jgi:hypothetical protein
LDRPPAIATWLLRHLGCSPNTSAIIGDLAERYPNGRSRAWYWRQTFLTILVGFATELCAHRLLAIRAVLFSSLVTTASLYLTWLLSRSWIGGRAWLVPNRILVIALITAVLCAGSARLAALMYRPHEKAMTLVLLGFQLLGPYSIGGVFPLPVFWTVSFGYLLHVWLWNTGMSGLDSVCHICFVTPSAYHIFVQATATSLTSAVFLLGSGIFEPRTN